MALSPGLTAAVDLRVEEMDTAEALASGDVAVLGTPRLVALCEQATCEALTGLLGPDETSVAKRVQFDHLAPVAIGSRVRAEATLERIEGRRLTFSVSVSDTSGLVGAGKVTRVIVERSTFLAKAR
ncbi:MAG: thioesterase [Actinomycetota bacterium]|nr:thioesterase [Actinomycetota bacterium]